MVFYAKLYAATTAVFFALDIAWLGFVAKGVYQRQMGHLLAEHTRWSAAIAFYLIYVAAIIILCVMPAVEKHSVVRALALGAVFGLAAYAAFDLTSLALMKGFPSGIVPLDLAWGVALTASVSAAGFYIARWLGNA